MISPISGQSQELPSTSNLLASSKGIPQSKTSYLSICASNWGCYRCLWNRVQKLWFSRVATLWPSWLWHSLMEEDWKRPSHQHSSLGSLTEELGDFWVSKYCPADGGLCHFPIWLRDQGDTSVWAYRLRPKENIWTRQPITWDHQGSYVHFLHMNCIIHWDLNPKNVLVGQLSSLNLD